MRQRFDARLAARSNRQEQLLMRERQERRAALQDDGADRGALQLELDFNPQPVVDDSSRPAPALPEPMLNQPYQLPPLSLLEEPPENGETDFSAEINECKSLIQNTIDSFGIDADVADAVRGPRVTLYQINVAKGVHVGVINGIQNDLCMALAAQSIRVLAPVPGQDYVGVEVPNRQSETVFCSSLLKGRWQDMKKGIPVVLGRDISGDSVCLDLARAPHLLVAGATGSGKSVCLNGILISLLCRFAPEDLRLILIDPKVVELSVYNGLPHLLVPVVTDLQLTVMALRWAVREMERRYRVLAKAGKRNIEDFNARTLSEVPVYDDDGELIPKKLPFIVVIIDELADIMLSNRSEVETSLARLAQMARAVGIHVVVATQRPSVNIITGVITANFPTRIAFQVASQIDSRTILDGKGAESLLGKGDMLFRSPSAMLTQRLQGAFVTDEEIQRVVAFCAAQGEMTSDFDLIRQGNDSEAGGDGESATDSDANGGMDEALIQSAIDLIVQDRKATVSYLQRRLRIGYNRAATLMEVLEKRGVVGPQPASATAPREILVD